MRLRWLAACALAAACADASNDGSGEGTLTSCPAANTNGPVLRGACHVKPELTCQSGHFDCGSPITSGFLAFARCVDGQWQDVSPGSCGTGARGGSGGQGGGAGKGSAGKGGTAGASGRGGGGDVSGEGGEAGAVASSGAGGESGSR